MHNALIFFVLLVLLVAPCMMTGDMQSEDHAQPARRTRKSAVRPAMGSMEPVRGIHPVQTSFAFAPREPLAVYEGRAISIKHKNAA